MKKTIAVIVIVLGLAFTATLIDANLNENTKVEEIHVVTLVDECGKEYYRDTIKKYSFLNNRFMYSRGDSSMSLPVNNLILKTIKNGSR